MIEVLLACSPPLDGRPFTCPPHDYVLERKAEPVKYEEKDNKNPFDKRVLFRFRYYL